MKKIITVLCALLMVGYAAKAHATFPTWTDGQIVSASDLDANNDSTVSAIADTAAANRAILLLKTAARDTVAAVIADSVDLSLYTPLADVRDSADAAIAADATKLNAAAFDDSLHGVVNPAGLADSTYLADGRPYVWDCGGTVKFGDVVYIAADSDYEGADADALTTMPALAVCVTPGGAAGGGTATFITSGWVKWSGWTNITAASDSVYAYVGTDAGSVTEVKPSGAGDIIQVVGTIHGDGLVHLDLDKTEVTVP